MSQLLLIPDPRPLDERLGEKFFREAPRQTGVYLMRDAADKVLYVGKAKNLRQRLQCYRVANPDRMPRRHLRMLREVARIEFQFCADETAALGREAGLLRSLKPRFNRAGVWQGKRRFFAWRVGEERLDLAVTEAPESGWQCHGSTGWGSAHLHRTLSRLFWLALNPARMFGELPVGWAHGRIPGHTDIYCGDAALEVGRALTGFFSETPDVLISWLKLQFATRTHPFEIAVLKEELELLAKRKQNKIPA
jgi:excinuclease ABC subunit C